MFFVFQARTGHLVAIAMVSLAIMWALPRRWRLAALLCPLLVLAALNASSEKIHTRFSLLSQEVFAFANEGVINSSSGLRLNLWHRATQTIAEHPLAGSGVGSWEREFVRLEAARPRSFGRSASQPASGVLAMGVSNPVPWACCFFIAILGAAWRDSLAAQRDVRRSQQSVLIGIGVAAPFNCTLYDA
ncbi:MAG: O-antigen ligase family protein [Rhodoferax sp.]|nr:O-antigen ligase family protein [Rhodoferax sp.]